MTDRDEAPEIRAVQTGALGVVVGVTACGESGQSVHSVFLVGNREGQWADRWHFGHHRPALLRSLVKQCSRPFEFLGREQGQSITDTPIRTAK